jgi:preprotein translocase subunit SecE
MAKVTSSGTGDNAPRPAKSVPKLRTDRGLKNFFQEIGREMKKVNWPTRAETNRLTGVVLAVCLLLVVVLTALSYAFDLIVKFIVQGSL